MNSHFWFDDIKHPTPSNVNFYLHAHEHYEILMFLEGDTNFIVEENEYNLNPYDMIVIKKNQLHRAYHNSCTPYHRLVINILPTFFTRYECKEYELLFTDSDRNIGNMIKAEDVKKSGLRDALFRIKDYSQNYQTLHTPIVRSGIIEMLYLLDNIKLYSDSTSKNTQLREIIAYTNEHYTENLTLEELAKKFYISKYYLCHSFRDETGLSFHQYLTKKRLLLAKDLLATGKNISDVAELVGFRTYSSFYRAYLNEFGTAPKYAPRNKSF